MACIYKITNTLNGKSYVGQTQRDPQIHWRNYRYGAAHHKKYKKTGRAILNAIVAHGIEHFTFEILEVCENERLNDLERSWIARLRTNGDEGYNLTCGGQDRYTRKTQVHNKHSEETKAKISAAHRGRSHVGWRTTDFTEQERRNKSFAAERQKVKIERWSINGQLLEVHDSLSAVKTWMLERGLTTESSRVIHVRPGHVKLCKGYWWRRVGDEVEIPKIMTRKGWMPVVQLTESGECVATHSSIKHAIRELQQQGIKAHKNVIKACLASLEKKAYGFKWQIALL